MDACVKGARVLWWSKTWFSSRSKENDVLWYLIKKKKIQYSCHDHFSVLLTNCERIDKHIPTTVVSHCRYCVLADSLWFSLAFCASLSALTCLSPPSLLVPKLVSLSLCLLLLFACPSTPFFHECDLTHISCCSSDHLLMLSNYNGALLQSYEIPAWFNQLFLSKKASTLSASLFLLASLPCKTVGLTGIGNCFSCWSFCFFPW